MKRTALFLCLLALGLQGAKAQKLGLKTNLLYDATATVNLGLEARMAPKWTFDLSGNYNGWSFKDNKKWKHWLAQPEARYWFCEAFNGHFVALHALGGQFNVGNVDIDLGRLSRLKDHRYEGYYYGAGIGYGYQWVLTRRLNLEAEVGGGWIRSHFDKYACTQCGDFMGHSRKDYFGLTKVALSLVVMLK